MERQTTWRVHPTAATLRVKFAFGDDLQIRFTEHADAQRLIAKYGISQETLLNVCGPFPFVTAEVSMKFAASGDELTPKGTTMPGVQVMGSLIAAHNTVGFSLP